MAKIPSQAIQNVLEGMNTIKSRVNDIEALVRVVNQDSVDWHGIPVTINEEVRQQLVDQYEEFRTVIINTAQNLPTTN